MILIHASVWLTMLFTVLAIIARVLLTFIASAISVVTLIMAGGRGRGSQIKCSTCRHELSRHKNDDQPASGQDHKRYIGAFQRFSTFHFIRPPTGTQIGFCLE